MTYSLILDGVFNGQTGVNKGSHGWIEVNFSADGKGLLKSGEYTALLHHDDFPAFGDTFEILYGEPGEPIEVHLRNLTGLDEEDFKGLTYEAQRDSVHGPSHIIEISRKTLG